MNYNKGDPMNTWKELATTRKTLMTVVEALAVILALGLLAAVILGTKGISTQSQAQQALTNVQQALAQFENNSTGNLEFDNLKSMSSLPQSPMWTESHNALEQSSLAIEEWTTRKKALPALQDNFSKLYENIDKEAKNQIQSNQQVQTAQDIQMAAQSLHSWVQAPPKDAEIHMIESKVLDASIRQAEQALAKNPQSTLKPLWDAWMSATQLLLEGEQAELESKQFVQTKLSAYAIQLQKASKLWLDRTTSTFTVAMMIFGIVVLIILVSLQLLKKNPHLNTMFAPKGTTAMQAELAAITEQVDSIMDNVAKTWLDARAELKVVHHAVADTEILEEQVQKLKTDVATVVNHLCKGLQDLEHKTRHSDSNTADQLGSMLAEVQMQSARLQQSMDVLADSGLTLHDELAQVQKSIRNLMKETQALKNEGETLEDSSSALRSSLE